MGEQGLPVADRMSAARELVALRQRMVDAEFALFCARVMQNYLGAAP